MTAVGGKGHMIERRAFWVRFTGVLTNDPDATVDHDDPDLQPFIDRLATQLVADSRLTDAGVLFVRDGRIAVSAALMAPSRGQALDTACTVLEEAIMNAGGEPDVGNGADPAWIAKELIHEGESTVKELLAA